MLFRCVIFLYRLHILLDIHTIDSGWGGTTYPCVVGHEIVGTIHEKGSDVRMFQIGDVVGIGKTNLFIILIYDRCSSLVMSRM